MATNKQHLIDTTEEFNIELENHVNDAKAFPWAPLVRTEFVTHRDYALKIADKARGLLPVIEKGEAMRDLPLPGDTYKTLLSVPIGGVVTITDGDVTEQSGNFRLDGTNIVIKREKGQAKQDLIRRAIQILIQRSINTIGYFGAKALTGEITHSNQEGQTFGINTNVTNGGPVTVLWSDIASTPIADMEAINLALEVLAGNYGRNLANGHTIMSNAIRRALVKITQIRELLKGNGFDPARVTLGDLARNSEVFLENFGEAISHNSKYFAEDGTETDFLPTDTIFCASGTQVQPAITIGVAPGGLDDRFSATESTSGLSIVTNEVPARSLKESDKTEVAAQGVLYIMQTSPIYKKKVL